VWSPPRRLGFSSPPGWKWTASRVCSAWIPPPSRDQAPSAGCLPLGTIDGHVLPRQLVDVFDRGEQAHVPVLVGFNSGEVRSLPFLAPPPPATAVAYVTAVRDRYGPLADALLRLYPSSDIRGAYSPSRVTRSKSWTAERVATKQAAIGEYTILYFRSRLFRCGSRRAARLPRQ
jgi:para-nitrobenzyl esterase